MSQSLANFSVQHIRDIKDPEHPYTLEELNVVIEDNITVDDALGKIKCVWVCVSCSSVRSTGRSAIVGIIACSSAPNGKRDPS